MQKWWERIRYFKPSEFDSKDAPGSGVMMDRLFLWKLDAIRHEWNEPLRITSGYRTAQHNATVGGAPNSGHRHGRAADISTKGWTKDKRERFARLCKQFGMTGLGLGSTFIHVDDLTGTEGAQRPLRWEYVNGKAGGYQAWV